MLYTVQIVSHLPVEAAAIALGNVANISDAIQDLRRRLNQSRSLLDLTDEVCTVFSMH